MGHGAGRHRLFGGSRGGEGRHDRGIAVLSSVTCLFAARPRTRQPLSIVSGARVAADETGRTRRADPAFRDCDRSRQRSAAQTSARSNRDRHLARVRQPPAHLPDSPQHAIRRVDHVECRPHRRVEVPLRSDRCRRVGAGRPGGGAAAGDLAIAPRVVESRQSRDPRDRRCGGARAAEQRFGPRSHAGRSGGMARALRARAQRHRRSVAFRSD